MDPVSITLASIALVGSIITGILTIINNKGINLSCNGSSKKSCLHHCLNSTCCITNGED